MKRVVLHIERVVLNGYAHADRHAIAEALREELTRHYADPAAVQGLQGRANVDRLNAGRVQLGAAAEPAAVGRHAAGAITKGLAR
jgi:hypothetical protein